MRRTMMKNKVTIDGDTFRIILYEKRNETDVRIIDCSTSKNGSLTVGGYDLGSKVKKLTGRSDYEYDATVAAEDKIALYAALQKELFDGHDDFNAWTTDNGIMDVEACFNVVLLLMVKKLGLYPHNFRSWLRERDIEVCFWSYP
jgi:hypothetical protein